MFVALSFDSRITRVLFLTAQRARRHACALSTYVRLKTFYVFDARRGRAFDDNNNARAVPFTNNSVRKPEGGDG